MTPTNGASIYSDVEFHFFHPKPDENDNILTGCVIIRPGDMVLKVMGGYRPEYVIIGHPRLQPQQPYLTSQSTWFEGEDKKGSDATAYWSDVGIKWAGIWREDEMEWHFSFVLNPSNNRLVSDDE